MNELSKWIMGLIFAVVILIFMAAFPWIAMFFGMISVLIIVNVFKE
jgi:hypothetical protein